MPVDFESNTLDDLFPGSMDEEQAKAHDRKLVVQFFMHHTPDYVATEGGYIEGRIEDGKVIAEDEGTQDRVDELVKVGCRFSRMPKSDGVLKVKPCGRPVYRTVEFLRILKPGDRDNVVEQPLDNEYRLRFKERYDKWKAGVESGAIGTPLEELPWLNSGQREELKYFHIYTVENLADMADREAQKFPNGTEMRLRAARYLEAAEKKAPFDEVHQEIKARDAKITDLEEQINAMKAQLQAFETKPTKR